MPWFSGVSEADILRAITSDVKCFTPDQVVELRQFVDISIDSIIPWHSATYTTAAALTAAAIATVAASVTRAASITAAFTAATHTAAACTTARAAGTRHRHRCRQVRAARTRSDLPPSLTAASTSLAANRASRRI